MTHQQTQNNPKQTVIVSSLLILLLSMSPQVLSNEDSSINVLENQIREWLAHKKVNSTDLDIRINDSRLQIPQCSKPFILSSQTTQNLSSNITVRASCPQMQWSRLIRVSAKKERIKQERVQIEIEKELVFVIAEKINQYEKITADKLSKIRLAKNKIPAAAINSADPLGNLYARRALRSGQVISESDVIKPQKVIIVNSAMPAQSLIMASDLSTGYRIKEIPHDAVKSLEGIKNLATNRLLHAGDVLRKRDHTKAKLIKRGELVMVEAKSNHFQIVNEAIAFQDGYFGDQIKLTSVDTKKPISARVIGKGKVRTLSKQWIIK